MKAWCNVYSHKMADYTKQKHDKKQTQFSTHSRKRNEGIPKTSFIWEVKFTGIGFLITSAYHFEILNFSHGVFENMIT